MRRQVLQVRALLEVLSQRDVTALHCSNDVFVFEFSLCLSRACLGKKIIIVQNVGPETYFRTG